ncbi:hypothetical protein V5799_007080 [Amblyomma americanum]|uniref:Uncharacterized protein n=1 Tax=Amblyomma americanum TaxID=6943 RepID=A0AAQ4DUJ9_AMBAM
MASFSGHEILNDEKTVDLYTSATESGTGDSKGVLIDDSTQGNYSERTQSCMTSGASAYWALHYSAPRSSYEARSVDNATQPLPANIPMVIRFEDQTIRPWDLEPRSIEEAIGKAAAGDVLSIKTTASGLLLANVSCSETAVRMQRVKTLLGAAVQVTVSNWYHRNEAMIRGVPFYVTNEQILDALVPYGVMGARRAVSYTRLDNGVCLESPKNTVMLNFTPELAELPATVSLEGEEYRVQTFRRPPMQCMNCFGFEHSAFRCRAETRCKLCAGFHNHRECTATAYRCVNCDGCHAATYTLCPAKGCFKEKQSAPHDAIASF